MCDCQAVLLALAAEELVAADKAARRKTPGVNEELTRRRATSLAWAAGELRRHQHVARPPPKGGADRQHPTLFEEQPAR